MAWFSRQSVLCLAIMVIEATAAGAHRRLPPPGSDQQRYHHLRYEDAKEKLYPLYIDDLGQNVLTADGKKCMLQHAVIAPLRKLIADANATKWPDGWELRVTSCFRPASDQKGIFLDPKKVPNGNTDPEGRAKKSAPPSFSEHATGYTIDFVVRPTDGSDARITCGQEGPPCKAEMDTKVGEWLLTNATKYGFELSFPCQDKSDLKQCMAFQGVSYEPWHWRWVGPDEPDGPDAAARKIFARARSCFKGDPGIPSAETVPESLTPIDCPPKL